MRTQLKCLLRIIWLLIWPIHMLSTLTRTIQHIRWVFLRAVLKEVIHTWLLNVVSPFLYFLTLSLSSQDIISVIYLHCFLIFLLIYYTIDRSIVFTIQSVLLMCLLILPNVIVIRLLINTLLQIFNSIYILLWFC
jgi:hypothetical protein